MRVKDPRKHKETVSSVHPSVHVQDTRSTNTNIVMDNQQSIIDIMRKQNEITTLLIDQQCVSSLPKRDVPVFAGDPLQYHTFMRAFENNVEKRTDNNSDRLYFLEQYTKGLSKELVRSCQYISPDRGYLRAKALLKEHFGNEHKVAAAYMDKVLSWPSIKTEDAKALQNYSLFLRSCCNVMDDLDYLHDPNVPANMLSVIKKLPYKIRDKWRTAACELQERTGRRCEFSDITEFIEKQVKVLTDPVFGNIQDAPPGSRSLTKPPSQIRFGMKESSFGTMVTPVSDKFRTETQEKKCTQMLRKKCLFCGEDHTLDSCEQLEKKPRKEKIGFLRENGVCFGCLCIGHISKECKRRISCAKCGFKHPTVLHITPCRKDETQDSTVVGKKPEVQQVRTLASNGLTGAGDQDCKLPIVPVQVKIGKGSKIVSTYAFLDQGSTAVFCTESLMHKLNVEGRKSHILLRTMGQEKIVDSHIINGLEVAAIQGHEFVALPKTYTQPSMPVQKCNIPLQSDLQKWPYLRDIHLPQINEEIELLIGVNVPKALEPLQVIQSEHDGPFAIRTMLGWTINGPLERNSGNTMDHQQPELSVNRVSVVQMDELWEKQFQIDFPECNMDEQPGLSQEDKKFMERVSDSANLIKGHYQISLPLRNKNVCMPNNKALALQRAVHLKKKLQRDPVFYTDYTAFMNDMFTKGYAERVPEEDLKRADGKVWYIPHHGVYHPVKKKLRVVFDCGASFQGTSLNTQLLQGPDLTSSLIGLVTRFRKEPVVMMADIESMFHQVKVPPEDADLLRFLWWPNGDLNSQLSDHRMTVHVFGATSSPSCANFALRKCAEDNKEQFNQNTVDTIMHGFYVDDCLVSVASEDEATVLHHELVSICAKGGFKLTKWMSNRANLLKTVPEEYQAKDTMSLHFNQDVLWMERVLGMHWSVQSDTFRFRITIKSRPLTRRGILSIVGSIYDPLGILSPVVLSAKLLLRDLCRRGVGWDDTIPEEIAQKWMKWLQELHLLQDFNTERCLKPHNFGEVTQARLHLFCDASEVGYGLVA
ncbi:uncharacterized protein LOC112138581, partial [Oryzias melastigma]|uniref:uncharacterized protein LOC112138581 n=1 Tax=Oryzias melastigma TaxID=30732 RepID=UPI000CF7C391